MDDLDKFLDKILPQIIDIFKADLISKGFPNRQEIKKVSAIHGGSNITVTVPASIVYWDGGRKPGLKRLAIVKILDWMKRVPIIPAKGKTELDVAWAIQTKIFKVGISKKGILESSLSESEKEIRKEIDNWFSDKLDDIIENQFL